MKEFDFSRHEAHQAIAKQYRTSMSVVYSYISYKASRKHQTQRPYSEAVKNPGFRNNRSFRNRFNYDPAKFIAPLYKSPDESLSLDDLALRMRDTYNYLPHTWKLEKIANEGNSRTGEIILNQVSLNTPPLFQLVNGLYDRYKTPQQTKT